MVDTSFSHQTIKTLSSLRAIDPEDLNLNSITSLMPTKTILNREPSYDKSESGEGEMSQSSRDTIELGKKRSRKDDLITDPEIWKQWIHLSIGRLRRSKVTQISKQYFTIEQELRCTVRNTGLEPFLIFPWFHDSNQQRFRQTLKKDDRRGATIEKVIEAMNYFLRKSGRDYSEEEIQFLQRYYEDMDIPIPSLCLSTIVEVYNEFRRFHEDITRKSRFLHVTRFRFLLIPPQSTSLNMNSSISFTNMEGSWI
jgi:hypothetical protein